jgi:hypothetical protein
LTWNRLRQFHEDPRVITVWRKALGPALRWLTPDRRRLLLGLGALIVAVRHPWEDLAKGPGGTTDLTGAILLVLALFGFVWLCYVAAQNFASLPVFSRRHPQISLHAIFWLLLIVLWVAPVSDPTLRTLLAGCALVMPFLLWRVGYMLFTAQRGKMAGTRFADHLAYIYPVWGGTNTPHGKGWDYLSANEARDEEALAKSQLSGIKLFLLAALWSICRGLLEGAVFGHDNAYRRALGGWSLGVPRIGELFAQPGNHPVWLCWLVLYLELIRQVLRLAAGGHVVIGYLRFFGFNVFRNTYKPLLAESVIEFWNRYYYYFKELLLNFFFFPMFARCFKAYPRLRIVAAVFMAAFVGNIYYHWLGLEGALATANFGAMWGALQSRVFYCFLLALGISVSMLREQRRDRSKPRGVPRRALAIFGVWTFYSIIHIWAQRDPASFVARTRFFLGIVGFD